MSTRSSRMTIAVVTGTRAEYGLLRPVMKAIDKSVGLRLEIIAAGMHLTPQFGKTISDIRCDGFRVGARVLMTPTVDSSAAMASSVGSGILGMVKALRKLKPGAVVVLGDRVEALAAAIASAYMNIPLAHIHGGDRSMAGLDESARHAITKFAHIHFAATKKSADRIRRLGESRGRIHVVGAPGLDEILHGKRTKPSVLARKYKIDNTRPLILVIQHPVTTAPEDGANQMRATLDAISQMDSQVILVYPNADAGGRRMISVAKSYERTLPHLNAYPSLPRQDFLGLMAMAHALVGNSSSGIIEAASFGIPVVNIGTRQEGRERAGNVIDTTHERVDIARAVKRALSGSFASRARRAKNPYGAGRAGTSIARVLRALRNENRNLLQKSMTY